MSCYATRDAMLITLRCRLMAMLPAFRCHAVALPPAATLPLLAARALLPLLRPDRIMAAFDAAMLRYYDADAA